MKQLKIKDNSQTKKERFSSLTNLTRCVADKTLEQLEREGVFVFPDVVKDAEDITSDQMILQGINDSYQSGNVMGFIGLGDERLIIESRFSTGGDDYLFQYLLSKVLDFPNIVNLEVNANDDDRMFNLLLFLFPQYLKSAMRKGLYKQYVNRSYNDSDVKGTIDVARHIRKNIPFVGNIAYNQREYSYDNYLMELIRHTIEYIKGKTYGKKLLATIKDEVKMVVDATPAYSASDRRKLIEDNKRSIVRHAYYHEYRALQQLCILILRNQKHQIGVGTRRIYGILFDGAWLWEEYMNILIGDKFYHPQNKAGKGSQYLFAGGRGRIYPDFIGKDQENRVIADAKYKPIDNIGNKDYLQVLAYMFRFDAKRGMYLYPEARDGEDMELVLADGVSYEGTIGVKADIRLIKHGLLIPAGCSSFDEFCMKIKKNEERFLERCV